MGWFCALRQSAMHSGRGCQAKGEATLVPTGRNSPFSPEWVEPAGSGPFESIHYFPRIPGNDSNGARAGEVQARFVVFHRATIQPFQGWPNRIFGADHQGRRSERQPWPECIAHLRRAQKGPNPSAAPTPLRLLASLILPPFDRARKRPLMPQITDLKFSISRFSIGTRVRQFTLENAPALQQTFAAHLFGGLCVYCSGARRVQHALVDF